MKGCSNKSHATEMAEALNHTKGKSGGTSQEQ